MPVLPRSLQRMIADAQKCEPLDVSDDEWVASDITAGVNEFVANLARGEYAEELYWECQGYDYEEDGHWLQALDAYQTILDLESSSDFDRDSRSELQAFRESLKLAEQLASDDPLSIVHAEYRVMRRLLALAAVCDRQGFAEEAAEHRARAERIGEQRKFPQAAKQIFSLQPDKPLSAWQRLLNRF